MICFELILRLFAERCGTAADQPDGFQTVLLRHGRHDERDREGRDENEVGYLVLLDRPEIRLELEAAHDV